MSLARPLLAGVDTELPPGAKDSAKLTLQPVNSQNAWTLGGGYAHRFNIKGSFRGLGGGINGRPLPSSGGATFGQYDDGFVRPDISGDESSTTFWNYQNGLQDESLTTGTLALSISSVPTTGSVSERDDASGFDLFARRELGMLTFLDQPVRWGLQARFNYSHIDLSNKSRLLLDVSRVTDRFPLVGVVPPLAPYTGSFAGPGPLLGTDATRSNSIIPNGALVSGSRSLEADLFAFSFGFWSEMNPIEQLSLTFEAGITLAIASGEFSQQSTTTFSGQSVDHRSRGSETDLLPGFYFGTGVTYAVTDDWSVYGGLRYEYLDDFSIRASRSQADLSFSGSLVASIGVGYQF